MGRVGKFGGFGRFGVGWRAKSVVYGGFFVGLGLLVWLGSWQWGRGVEKGRVEGLLAESHYSITLASAPQDSAWGELAYRRARLRGEWLTPPRAPVFLLANRTYRGRVGYVVLSPFQLAHDRAILLVNRGWVAQAENGGNWEAGAGLDVGELVGGLPHSGEGGVGVTEISGRLYVPQKGFTLGEAYVEAGGADSPIKVVQYFDGAVLAGLLGAELQGVALALEGGEVGAFTPHWRGRVLSAARHFGYAVQWWGLAITLGVFGVIWRRRERAGRGQAGKGQGRAARTAN